MCTFALVSVPLVSSCRVRISIKNVRVCTSQVVVGVGHSLRVTSFHIPPSVPEKGRCVFMRACVLEECCMQ